MIAPNPKLLKRRLPAARFLVRLITVLTVLLALRFMLILVGANFDLPIPELLTSFTDPLTAPFDDVVTQPFYPLTIDFGALIAIAGLQVASLVVRAIERRANDINGRRLQEVVAGGFIVLLVVADAVSFELFASLAIAAASLLVLSAARHPRRIVEAVAWIRVNARRSAILGAVTVAVVLIVALTGDAVRHPRVTAAEQGADWAAANGALAQIVAADLQCQAAPPADRAAKVNDLQLATRRFDDAVRLLERIRPPEGRLHAHQALTAVYLEMASTLDLLPGVRARNEADRAALVWSAVGVLGEEAASFVQLGTSP